MPSVLFRAVHRMHSHDASEFSSVHHEGLVLLLLLPHKAQEEHTMMSLFPFLRGLLFADLTLLLYVAPTGFGLLFSL